MDKIYIDEGMSGKDLNRPKIKELIEERHRHRYEFNNEYKDKLLFF